MKGNTGGEKDTTEDQWRGWKARPNNRANTWSGKTDPKKDRLKWKREHKRA